MWLLLCVCSVIQEEVLFETTSEEESGGEESGDIANAVLDVEDLGKMVGQMRNAKVMLLAC